MATSKSTSKSKSKPAAVTPVVQPPVTSGSRIAEALAYAEREGVSIAEAARKFELNESGLFAARRKARALAQRLCPVCGGAVDADGVAVKSRRH